MRLIRFKTGTEEKNGVVVNGGLVEIPHSLLEASQAPFDDLERKDFYSLDDVNILPPVQPSKVVCVGLNYRDHAQELNMDLPEEPILFIKPPTTVIGPDNPIIYPPQCHQLDYEAELGVVLGRDAKKVAPNQVHKYIFGYTVVNDVSARNLQTRHKQWYLGKSLDGFFPMGPCIVTPDEIPNLYNLAIGSSVNGEQRQHSNTKFMIQNVAGAVSELSQGMTLKAGTIIAMGTPAGVGMGFKPPRFLKPGDTVTCEIEKIGKLENVIGK